MLKTHDRTHFLRRTSSTVALPSFCLLSDPSGPTCGWPPCCCCRRIASSSALDMVLVLPSAALYSMRSSASCVCACAVVWHLASRDEMVANPTVCMCVMYACTHHAPDLLVHGKAVLGAVERPLGLHVLLAGHATAPRGRCCWRFGSGRDSLVGWLGGHGGISAGAHTPSPPEALQYYLRPGAAGAGRGAAAGSALNRPCWRACGVVDRPSCVVAGRALGKAGRGQLHERKLEHT